MSAVNQLLNGQVFPHLRKFLYLRNVMKMRFIFPQFSVMIGQFKEILKHFVPNLNPITPRKSYYLLRKIRISGVEAVDRAIGAQLRAAQCSSRPRVSPHTAFALLNLRAEVVSRLSKSNMVSTLLHTHQT